jgi:phospholipid transport system substrate-binding protein
MFLRRLAPLIVTLALPLTAAAAGKSPLETLKDAQTRLDKILSTSPAPGSKDAAERRAKLEAEAKPIFDFEELAKRSLGKNWEAGTPAEQKEFVDLFSQIVSSKYLDQVEGRSSKSFTLSWGKETLSGTEATVESNLKGKDASGKPIEVTVTYKLIQKGTDWKVYDVVTDSDSLLALYKDSFKKKFKKEGSFEGVLKDLRTRAPSKSASK